MRKVILSSILFLSFCLIFDQSAFATNGAQFIGAGPASKSMGGTGIANPQSGVASIYLNPATMVNFKKTTVDFSAAVANFSIDTTAGTLTGTSRYKPFAIPSIGWVAPISKNMSIGLAAVAAGGMGADYRGTGLTAANYSNVFILQFDFIPAFAMKFGNFSIGLSLPLTLQLLEFSGGSTNAGVDHGYGLAGKLGIGYDLKKILVGAYFKFPIIAPSHETGQSLRSAFSGTTSQSIIKVAPPMELGLGVGLKLIKNLDINLDGKYIFWDSAAGYGDNELDVPYGFDWKNQFVIGVGIQYKAVKWLDIRAGYNYGSSVLKTDRTSATSVQAYFNTAAPAVATHHITGGFGIGVSKSLKLDLGVVWSPKSTYNSTGTNFGGGTQSYSSSMSQFTFDFGLSGNF